MKISELLGLVSNLPLDMEINIITDGSEGIFKLGGGRIIEFDVEPPRLSFKKFSRFCLRVEGPPLFNAIGNRIVEDEEGEEDEE